MAYSVGRDDFCRNWSHMIRQATIPSLSFVSASLNEGVLLEVGRVRGKRHTRDQGQVVECRDGGFTVDDAVPFCEALERGCFGLRGDE